MTITYNNSTIHTASSAESFTLPTNGKVMASDLVFTLEGSLGLQVSYGNSEIINTQSAGTHTLPCSGKIMSGDITGTLVSSGPPPAPVDWATDSWATIQAVSVAGKTAQTYGSQVGATRQITLTDNTTMTIRLSNADDTMYTLSDNSRTSGLCMEFVDCFPTTAQMNTSNTNAGGWNACAMRTVTMAQLYDLLPSDLKDVLATVNIKAANGGSGTISVVDSADKLFLLAEKEVFGTRTYSVTAEADALTQWKWYQDHNTNADRVKKRNGSASYWWLRSPRSGYSYYFCIVFSSGSAGRSDAFTGYGVSPGFVI